MTPELKVVFDIVSDLRLEASSYIFSFKLSDTLTRLDRNKDSIKYGIGVSELKHLLDELATQYGVQLDYVEEIELNNNHLDYRWKYGKYDWIYEDVQVGQDIRDFFGKVYINIDRPQIKAINDATDKKYVATLSYEDPCFIITYDDEKYILPALSYGKPYIILNYIMQNRLTDAVITRRKLANRVDKLKNLNDFSLTTDIFESNRQVRILKPFIIIKPESIMIKTSTKLTALELRIIIDACE